MNKEVSQVYGILTNGVMSGLSTITSSATGVIYRDTVGFQFQWTGNPVGVFTIQESLDYNPGTPQSGGAFNAGNWTTISFQTTGGSIVTSIAIGSGSAQPISIRINQTAAPWIQAVYTNSTASGVLTGFVTAKSLG